MIQLRYANVIDEYKINNSELKQAYIVAKELIKPKIDLRITVTDKKVCFIKILKGSSDVEDDWRKEKDDVKFIPIIISEEIEISVYA